MTQDERFDRIEDTLERLGSRFDQVDRRFDQVDRRSEQIEKYVQEFRGETIDRLTVIENRLDGLNATVANIDARLPALTKSMLDAGAFATQQVKEQARLKASDADLASRIAKLEETVAKLLQPAA
jgi:chromosome segregation ATPase